MSPSREDSPIAPIEVDIGALTDPDAATIGALARLHLIARRLGCQIRYSNAHEEVRELVTWMGLSEVLPLCPELPLVLKREAKEGKETLGFEEEADPDDPAV